MNIQDFVYHLWISRSPLTLPWSCEFLWEDGKWEKVVVRGRNWDKQGNWVLLLWSLCGFPQDPSCEYVRNEVCHLASASVGSDAGDLCTTSLSSQDHVCVSLWSCIRRKLPWGCWNWLSAGGALCPSGGPRSCWQGDRGHQPATTTPQQKRWWLGHSGLRTHNLESEISFIFFGEVSFTRQLVILWVLFKLGETWGKFLDLDFIWKLAGDFGSDAA